jgi:hypothetical protein
MTPEPISTAYFINYSHQSLCLYMFPRAVATAILQDGVSLPPPTAAPKIFQTTQPSHLLDEVVPQLLHEGIIRIEPRIVNAFRLFLVAKPNGAARPILDLSPWTDHYAKPPMRFYSAAEVLVAIRPTHQLIKIDLPSGFFQLRISPQHQRFYGISIYKIRRDPSPNRPLTSAFGHAEIFARRRPTPSPKISGSHGSLPR